MATTEFSTGKTIVVLAIVIGCFAVLWPNVFYPMMQTAFIMTKPQFNDEQGEMVNYPQPSVCCGVIYESKIDLKFFAELCKSVIDRESATDAGIRKYRRGTYPPPGMLERCRKKILELCNIDISEALTKRKKGKIAIDSRQTTTTNDTKPDQQSPQLNLTECLEKHFDINGPLPRRSIKGRALPRHIRQERPQHVGSSVPHPALMKKGSPFYPAGPSRGGPHPGKQSQMASHRPTLGDPGKPGHQKGGGAMSFIMPIYTVGIVVFFLYTITKVLFRRSESSTAPKIMDFHMDPEYRKYVLSEEYDNGVPLSYKDYLKKREIEDQNRKSKLLGSHGRKQVFTAIEGIIAEMDEFRDKLMAEQAQKNVGPEDDDIDTTVDEESMAASEMDISGMEQVAPMPESENAEDADIIVSKLQDLEERASKLSEPINQLAEQLKKITEDPKIAVVGMETQAEFQEKSIEPEANEVSNIVLETSLPSDGQLLVAESQLLTHTSTDHIEGWSDYDEQPVVVTGKMTISLLGKEASVHSTESKTSRRPGAPYKLPGHEVAKTVETDKSRQQIEELANALIEDILHNQIPKVFEKTAKSKGSTPDIDSYEIFGTSCEQKKETSSSHRTNFKKHGSQESLNSQGSSFEYVSACQDEPSTPRADDRLRLSLSPASDQGSCGNGGFEMIKSGGNHFPQVNSTHQNDVNLASPENFEYVSVGSSSSGFLSPEYENSFEKVNATGDMEFPNKSIHEKEEELEAPLDQIQQLCDLSSISTPEEKCGNGIETPLLVSDVQESPNIEMGSEHGVELTAESPIEERIAEGIQIVSQTSIEASKHEYFPETLSSSHEHSELTSDLTMSTLPQEDHHHLSGENVLESTTETTSVLQQPSIINDANTLPAHSLQLDESQHHSGMVEGVDEVERPDVDNVPTRDEHDVSVQLCEDSTGNDVQ